MELTHIFEATSAILSIVIFFLAGQFSYHRRQSKMNWDLYIRESNNHRETYIQSQDMEEQVNSLLNKLKKYPLPKRGNRS